jgi:hypothetical protein
MKMICIFFFFGSITFSQTGKMYLSYQIGQGYWGDGGVCPERGGFDLPKNPVFEERGRVQYCTVALQYCYTRVLYLYSSLDPSCSAGKSVPGPAVDRG